MMNVITGPQMTKQLARIVIESQLLSICIKIVDMRLFFSPEEETGLKLVLILCSNVLKRIYSRVFLYFRIFCDVKKRHNLGSVGRVPAKVNKKIGSGGWFRRLPARSPKSISFSLMVFTLKWLIFPINRGLKWCL